MLLARQDRGINNFTEQRQNVTGQAVYDPPMDAARDSLARNIKALRLDAGWTQEELRIRAGISQKTISNMESPDKTGSPYLNNIEAVAAVFGLQAWQLLIPWLPDELARNPRLVRLVRGYAQLSDDGRETVDKIVDTVKKSEKK